MDGYSAQLAKLRQANYTHPPFSTRYPRLAQLNGYISTPLLGNCSNDPRCAPGPWGNSIGGNAAVNATGAVLELPSPGEFSPERFHTSGNFRLPLGEEAQFVSSTAGQSYCFQLKPTSPLFTDSASTFTRIPEEQIGTVAFRKAHPCPSSPPSPD
jgi:hypothetical protein